MYVLAERVRVLCSRPPRVPESNLKNRIWYMNLKIKIVLKPWIHAEMEKGKSWMCLNSVLDALKSFIFLLLKESTRLLLKMPDLHRAAFQGDVEVQNHSSPSRTGCDELSSGVQKFTPLTIAIFKGHWKLRLASTCSETFVSFFSSF